MSDFIKSLIHLPIDCLILTLIPIFQSILLVFRCLYPFLYYLAANNRHIYRLFQQAEILLPLYC